MGYDLHITRAEFWPDNRGAEITADEYTGDEPLDQYHAAAEAIARPLPAGSSWWRRLVGR